MKRLLTNLREVIELDPNTIQFNINGEFYELNKDKRGNWTLLTVFGSDLSLDTTKFKRMSRNSVIKELTKQFENVRVY